MRINHCVFGGGVTNVSDVTNQGTDKAFLTFTVYIFDKDTRKKTVDGEDNEPLYIRCIVFGKTADFAAQYLAKNTQVVVMGKFEKRRYKAKDGAMKDSYQLRVRELQLAGTAPEKKETASAGHTDPDLALDEKVNGNVADEEVVIPGEYDGF